MKKNLIRAAGLVLAAAVATPAMAGGITVAKDGDKKLKFEALMFLNTTMNKTTTQAGTQAKSTGLAVDRAYFTAKYYFNKDWMMRFTTDINQDTALAGKKQNVYLKYAYVEGKLAGDAAVLRLGQSHTPWIDYEQHLWKHRFVAKVASDHFKFDDSSDLGIGLKGKLADGMLGYWVTGTTGAGYGNTAGSTNATDWNARVGVYPLDGLTLDVQYRTGYRGTKTFTGGVGAAGTKSTLSQVMMSYGMGHDFRVGANYLNNKKDNNAGTVTKDKVYAVWGWAGFGEGFGAFARYEHDKNSVNGANAFKTTHYVAGASYDVVKGVTFSLAFDHQKKDNLNATYQKDTKAGLYSQIKL